MNMDDYRVKKVLNNNFIQAYKEGSQEEVIILGRGIGFGMKSDGEVNPQKIEKIFSLRNTTNLIKYKALLEKCDEQLAILVEEHISHIGDYFQCPYDENIHIGLLDHIIFAMYRVEHNLETSNLFTDEIAAMYPKEFEFAKQMLHSINASIDVELPETEASFIALHIHASIKGEAASQTGLYVEIISKCLQAIEEKYGIELDPMGLNRARLITHMKFALKRASENIEVEFEIVDSLKETYRDTFLFAQELADFIENNYGITFPIGEIGYLTLHIENVIRGERRKQGG